jgi:hypothetical protein
VDSSRHATQLCTERRVVRRPRVAYARGGAIGSRGTLHGRRGSQASASPTRRRTGAGHPGLQPLGPMRLASIPGSPPARARRRSRSHVRRHLPSARVSDRAPASRRFRHRSRPLPPCLHGAGSVQRRRVRGGSGDLRRRRPVHRGRRLRRWHLCRRAGVRGGHPRGQRTYDAERGGEGSVHGHGRRDLHDRAASGRIRRRPGRPMRRSRRRGPPRFTKRAKPKKIRRTGVVVLKLVVTGSGRKLIGAAPGGRLPVPGPCHGRGTGRLQLACRRCHSCLSPRRRGGRKLGRLRGARMVGALRPARAGRKSRPLYSRCPCQRGYINGVRYVARAAHA